MKQYEIQINGIPHTVLLDDEDAAARGLTAKAAKPAANKARRPANKAAKPALSPDVEDASDPDASE
ncbi:hypothetical protein [Microbacterium sp. No. 7]|uniref:hypothetical protein n=1 Tax=Microbacterium sp. No. 7 TaxID=1714373 RepID=UPI0006D0F09C|nr:hypothetical protein [Microbacterium sp. No. 7]ALJ20383.1 hypothetical protein AOA12_10860 [Microbacterium sp. No. 7]